MDKFLVIQTSFIGDVILATAIIESLHAERPEARLDILVRKGNESLFTGHPYINEVLIWDKKVNRNVNLWQLIKRVRKTKYSAVFNAHRFASSGLITWLSGSKIKSGFKKNPISFALTHTFEHEFDGKHETERNHQLLSPLFSEAKVKKPRLYPSSRDYKKVKDLVNGSYRSMAPTSVWFTKQWPKHNWIELCNSLPQDEFIYLLGASSDGSICDEISEATKHPNVKNLAGKLSLLQSTALMEGAIENYVNDSAPMHLASAVNAPTTVFFCSTIPQFGFGPLSENSKIIETKKILNCRPCGLHGHSHCPQGHFSCSEIEISDLA